MDYQDIAFFWGIGPIRSVENVESASGKVILMITEAGTKYILKRQDPVRLRKEYDLLSQLQAQVPIAVPIRGKNGALHYDHGEECWALYPFLCGQPIADQYDLKNAQLLGRAIGRLHAALGQLAGGDLPAMDLLADITGWVQAVLGAHQANFDQALIDRITDVLAEELGPIYQHLPQQIIHRDMHPGNMLFQGDKLTGIVDFELSVRGIRVFDPCYCATSILSGGFAQPARRDKWPLVLAALLWGYQENSELTRPERDIIIPVLYAIQLLFMAFCAQAGNTKAAQTNAAMLRWLEENRSAIDAAVEAQRR